MTVIPFVPRGQPNPGPKPPVIAGRVPPHDPEAEEAAVAAVLTGEADLVSAVLSRLKPEHFYLRPNQVVIHACTELFREGKPIDYVIVNGWLRDREIREVAVGDLARLAEATPYHGKRHVIEYCDKVLEKYRMRRAIAESQKSAAEGYGDVGNTQEWLDRRANEAIQTAREAAAQRTITGGEAAADAVKRAMDACERGDSVTGTSSGFPSLDKITAGFAKGDLVLVTGKRKIKENTKTTGVGKSSLALNAFGLNIATAGYGVLIFSIEDGRERVGARLISTAGRVPFNKLKNPRELTLEDSSALYGAQDRISRLPLRIDDAKTQHSTSIRARTMEVREEFRADGVELRCVVVDNAQMLTWSQERPNERNPNQAQCLSDFGLRMLEMAKDLEVFVLLLSQLNSEGRIAQCKALETHAQLWLEIRRDSEPEANGAEPASILIRKARDSQDDESVGVWWHGRYLLFTEEQYL